MDLHLKEICHEDCGYIRHPMFNVYYQVLANSHGGGDGLVTKSCPTLAIPWTVVRLLCPWDFPGKNTGVGCHFLL